MFMSVKGIIMKKWGITILAAALCAVGFVSTAVSQTEQTRDKLWFTDPEVQATVSFELGNTSDMAPFKSYTGAELGTICGYDSVFGSTGVAVAVTDDETTLFLGSNATGVHDRMFVIRNVVTPPTATALGDKGTIEVPDPACIGDPITVTPNSGYVITQITTNGIAIPGTLNQSTFTVTIGAGLSSITASFAKTNAWWVNAGVFKKVTKTDGFFGGSENMSQFGISEAKGYLAASRAPGDSSSQAVMYQLADLNAATPTTPAYVSKSVNNGIYFGEPTKMMANRSVTFVGDYLVGGNIIGTANWSLGYQLPAGGVPYTWQDADNGVVQMTASDGVGLCFMWQAPDGSVYASTYKGTRLGRYTLAGTTLTLDTTWGASGYVTLNNGSYGVVGAVIDGRTLVYVCTGSTGVFVVDVAAATPEATLLLSRDVTGRTQNMRITGTADNTPRLIVTDGGADDAIKVFDLTADGMALASATPVVTYAVADLGGVTCGGYSPISGTDDDLYGYLGNSSSAGDHPHLITLRHADYCPTTATQTVGANGSSTVKSATIYVYPDVNNTVTYTAAAGYRIAAFTNNSVEVAAAIGATSYALENIATGDAIVVTFEQIPATFIYICGNHGASDYTGEPQVVSYVPIQQDAITFTAADGYVIAQVATNGVGIAGILGQASFELPGFTVAPGETLQVTASFAKENAWWLDPFVRNDFLLTGDAYNSSLIGKTEDDADIFFGISKTGYYDTTSGMLQFNREALADAIYGAVAPVNGSKKFVWVDTETIQSVIPSRAAGLVLTGSSKGHDSDTRDRTIAWPLGGEWGDPNYGATSDERTVLTSSIPTKWQRLAPGVISTDGNYVYGNAFYQTGIHKLAIQKNEAGLATNLAYTGITWNLPTRANAMALLRINGKDLVYASCATGPMHVIDVDAVTAPATNATTHLPGITSTFVQMDITGKSDGTLRLIGYTTTSNVEVWDLAADGMSLLSAQPVVTLSKNEAFGAAAGTVSGFSPLDDDSRAFAEYQLTGNIIRAAVVEHQPDEFFVEGHFVCDGATILRDRTNTYANNGDVTATFTAPDGYCITGVKVEGVTDSNFTASSYTYAGTALADYVYVELTLDVAVSVNQALVGDVSSTVTAENTLVAKGGTFTATYSVTSGWISSVYTNGAPALDCSGNPAELTLTLSNIACDYNIVVARSEARPAAQPWYASPGVIADFAQVGASTADGCAGFHWRLDATDDFLAAPLHFTGNHSTLYSVKSLEAGETAAISTYLNKSLFSADVRGTAVSKPLNVKLVGSPLNASGVLSLPLNTAEFGADTNAFRIWTSNGATPDAMCFTADGQYLYANAYVGTQDYIYKYRVLNGLKSSGTNLVLEASWSAGVRVRDMIVARLGDKDIVYINGNGTLYVLDTSDTANTAQSLNITLGGNYANLAVAGIGAGTPHLYVFGGAPASLNVYSINAADYSLTLFKSYSSTELGAICGYAQVGTSATGVGVAVTDDEATLFLGANATGVYDHLFVIRNMPYPDWLLDCGLEGEALAAMQDKYDTWAANQTGVDLTAGDYSAQFLMNADAEAEVALMIEGITLDANGNITLEIKGTAGAATIDLGQINGVLYLSTAEALDGQWTTRIFSFSVPANIGTDGIARPEIDDTNGNFFKAKVNFAAPADSTDLVAPDPAP